jgi:tRNA(His) 5'-end guanylyltransferase
MIDSLGDRMKSYEHIGSGGKFDSTLPIIARCDGRHFSAFTRGMTRPFDPIMTKMMIDTTVYLVKETNACMGYTQSDEITLAWHCPDSRSQVWFDGRSSKMISQLAAQATLWFNKVLREQYPQYIERYPTFDARVWNVPNRTEGANVFVWREWDATKNSISMAASAFFSPKQLHGVNGEDKKKMLLEHGIDWNNYPVSFKRGTYVQRKSYMRPFDPSEIEKLPERHAARSNPNLLVERSTWIPRELPIITTIENREDVIFEGATPKIKE